MEIIAAFLKWSGWTRFTLYRVISRVLGLAMFLLMMREPLTLGRIWASNPEIGTTVVAIILVLIMMVNAAVGWMTYTTFFLFFTGLDLMFTTTKRKINDIASR